MSEVDFRSNFPALFEWDTSTLCQDLPMFTDDLPERKGQGMGRTSRDYQCMACGMQGHELEGCYSSTSDGRLSIRALARYSNNSVDPCDRLEKVFEASYTCQGLTEEHKNGVREWLRRILGANKKMSAQKFGGGYSRCLQ